MPDFNKYTNYTDNTSFSGVVYGAYAPVLEVEQNEMQEIFNTKLRGLTDIIGDCIIPSTGGSFSYANSSVSIRKCIAISHGFIGFVDNTNVSVSSVGDRVYVKLEEKTVTKSTALKEYGNVNGSSITNPIQDNRVGSETSRRKMIEVSVLNSSSALQDTTNVHYVLVGELTSSEVFTFKHVLTSNLVESINTLLNLPSAVESAENTAESAYNLAQGLSGQISGIIAQSGTSDTEVVAARTNGVVGVTSNTLKDRLDNDFYSLQESIPVIDSTFSRSDASAPAKETGDRLSSLETGIEGKQDTLLFDEAPLENSQHPVKSGGVFNVTKDTVTSVPNVTGMTDPNKKYLNETDGYLYEYDTTTATWKKKILPIQTEVEEIKEDLSSKTGLSEEAKQALLACFAKVAWTDEHGQDYYDALEDALYPPVDLVSISAVYTQSGAVYTTDSLDSLKPDLVVTAHYSDSTSDFVTGYTLSGTLVEGTSTVTVSYGGKTTTFDVTVTGLQDRDIPGTDMSWVRGYVAENGTIATAGLANGTWTSDYFSIPDGYVTFNITLSGASARRMAFFDSEQQIISRVLSDSGNIPSGAVYGRATIIKSELGNTSYDGTGTTITLKV